MLKSDFPFIARNQQSLLVSKIKTPSLLKESGKAMAMHPPKGVTQLLEKWSNGDQYAVSLSQVDRFARQPDVELLALHDALNELAAIDPQQSRIVELRFFGGLSIEETAEVLGVSHATVERDWKMARAWLRKAVTS